MAFSIVTVAGGHLDKIRRVDYLAGGRLDSPWMPTKTEPYVKGDLIHFPAHEVVMKDKILTLDVEAELLSIAVGCSKYYPRDYWNFYVNGRKVMDTIYTKDLPEGAYLMAVIPVNVGEELKFEYYNEEGQSKYVWFNYQFLV